MPEGDTVWRTAHHLDQAFAGTPLSRTEFRVPHYATADLRGEVVQEVVSRGKHLLMRVGAIVIHSHLQMEGSWHLYPLPRPRWRRPAHTARAVVENAHWQAVGFLLGRLDLLPRDGENAVVGHLGPDLLDPGFEVLAAAQRVKRDPERAAFLALLDQRNIAGFGNEYVNELLFLGGVSPLRPIGDVDDVGAIVRLGRRLIVSNARSAHRCFGVPDEGRRGTTQRWVYRRAGQPCRRCGTPIRRGTLGDEPTRERIVFWCPRCQAAPQASAGH